MQQHRSWTSSCCRSFAGSHPQVWTGGSFNEEDDRRAARIDLASIREAAIDLGRADEVDAVFVSCTSLRLIDAVTEIEAALRKPITWSNHAMAWHCLRLAGIDDRQSGFGTLFARPLRQEGP